MNSLRIVAWAVAGLGGLCGNTACGSPASSDPAGTPVPGAPYRADSLPGAPPLEEDLARQFARALSSKGAGYKPRTRHLRDDGSARYTNRLILEASPYLLQHAHNPVNWYPWGDEAFETARRLGRPVLLSIGYSTCHWCHVMEEESFEDEEIAAFLNAYYIAVKVDREERPDVDAIYMSAVQTLTGRGGWPMTTWLTPDRRPFFGGTYFPARDGDRGSGAGFLTLLRQLERDYTQQPQLVAQRATEISQRVVRQMQPLAQGNLPPRSAIADVVKGLQARFDPTDGGLGSQPKFPSSLPIRLLLRHHRHTGDQAALDMAVLTLERMAAGGLYDQLGGGFHRYSTDARWLVPHFEKMLYDNALLTLAYLEGYQVTGRDDFARVVEEILRYVRREMTSPAGGFYSATDADSRTPHGKMEEGWFFTWTPDEIGAVLEAEAARLFSAYYDVTAHGNFEGRSILHVTRSVEAVARRLGVTPQQFQSSLAASRTKLYAARLERPAPLRDDKILTSWNGLMISAFARSGLILDEPAWTEAARNAARFVLGHSRADGRLLRSHKDGQARHSGYLDDYAFLIAGLLDLYEATAELSWLSQAIELQATLDRHHQDPERGGYFMTSDDHESLLAREKPAHDGAEPSGNSVALMNLVRLHELTTDDRYRATAEKLLQAFSRSLRGSSEMLLALDFYHDSPKEIVIVAADRREQAKPFLDVLRAHFVPNSVLAVAVDGDDSRAQARLVPLLAGKVARGGQATAYVCQRGICKLPTNDAAVFEEQLGRSPINGSERRR